MADTPNDLHNVMYGEVYTRWCIALRSPIHLHLRTICFLESMTHISANILYVVHLWQLHLLDSPSTIEWEKWQPLPLIGLSFWDFSNVVHLIMAIHHFFYFFVRFTLVLQYSPFVIFLQMVSIPCAAHNRSQTVPLTRVMMISTGCQMVLNLWERGHNVL